MHFLGVDIGGTKSAVVLGALESPGQPASLRLIDRVAFPTEAQAGAQAALERLIAGGRTLLERHGLQAGDLERIGIACGGPLDSRRGVILSPPNLPGWDEVPVVEAFAGALDVPARLLNDADASALAEWMFGAGRGCRNLVFLTFGTGLGAGLILDGRLYSGTNDMAGEAGHLRLAPHGPVGYGKAGSFEGFCSGGGLAQLGRSMILEKLQLGQAVSLCPERRRLEELTAREVVEAARGGDPLALEILETCGSYLGRGLAFLVDILNPERVVIGGIFARAHDLLWPPAERTLRLEALPRSLAACTVVPAQLGETVGDHAALAVAVAELP